MSHQQFLSRDFDARLYRATKSQVWRGVSHNFSTVAPLFSDQTSAVFSATLSRKCGERWLVNYCLCDKLAVCDIRHATHAFLSRDKVARQNRSKCVVWQQWMNGKLMIETKVSRGYFTLGHSVYTSIFWYLYIFMCAIEVGPGMRQELLEGNVGVGVPWRRYVWRRHFHDFGWSFRSQAYLRRLPVLDARSWSRHRIRAKLHLLRRASLFPRSRARGAWLQTSAARVFNGACPHWPWIRGVNSACVYK